MSKKSRAIEPNIAMAEAIPQDNVTAATAKPYKEDNSGTASEE